MEIGLVTDIQNDANTRAVLRAFDQVEMWGLTGEDIDHWERAEHAIRHGGYSL